MQRENSDLLLRFNGEKDAKVKRLLTRVKKNCHLIARFFSLRGDQEKTEIDRA